MRCRVDAEVDVSFIIPTLFLPSSFIHSTFPPPPQNKKQVCVIGGGSFGIAMASIVAKKGIPTCILVRKEEVAAHINTHHSHPQYLSDLKLVDTITSSADPKVPGGWDG